MIHIQITAVILIRLIDQRKYTLCTCNGSLDGSVKLSNFIDRSGELLCVNNKCRDRTDGDQSGISKVSAKCCNDHKADIRNTVHDRSHRTAQDFRLDADSGQLIRSSAELLDHIFLLIVCNNGLVPCDHFLRMTI